MTFRESYRLLIAKLQPVFGGGETISIARILYEDLYGMMAPSSDESRMTQGQMDTFDDACRRLITGEPINYITGVKEFYGRRFKVGEGVLIPRPETEELIDWILEDLGTNGPKHILDIGTGSGCIPITLDLETKGVHHVEGVDISTDALDIARSNNEALEAQVSFVQMDALNHDLNADDSYDIIVSNPPYILSSERHLMNDQVLDHEPSIALFTDGDDPLIFYREINQIAMAHLNKGGALFYEISALHKEAMMDLMKADGFESIEVRKDISGNWRMIKGTKG